MATKADPLAACSPRLWPGLSRAIALLPPEVQIPPDEALRLACMVNVNSHGVAAANSFSTHIGFALLALLPLFNHSCRPNCVFTYHGGSMNVRPMNVLSCS